MFLFAVALLLLGVLAYLSSQNWNPQPSPVELAQSSIRLLPYQNVKLAVRSLLEEPGNDEGNRAVLPTRINLYALPWGKPVPIDDQGPYGSCTAHAMRYAWQLWKRRTTNTVPFLPSRCFWYALSRMRMGDYNFQADHGSTNEDTVMVLRDNGAVNETAWSYSRANIIRAPDRATMDKAKAHKASNFKQLVYTTTAPTTLRRFQEALAQQKPILLAVLVYSSFMTTGTLRTGSVPLPNIRGERLLGGHAVCLSGYDNTTQRFSFRNSWGSRVGAQGTFTIPYSYVTNPRLCGDAWIIG